MNTGTYHEGEGTLSQHSNIWCERFADVLRVTILLFLPELHVRRDQMRSQSRHHDTSIEGLDEEVTQIFFRMEISFVSKLSEGISVQITELIPIHRHNMPNEVGRRRICQICLLIYLLDWKIVETQLKSVLNYQL